MTFIAGLSIPTVINDEIFPIKLVTGQTLVSALIEVGKEIYTPGAIVLWMTDDGQIIDFAQAPKPSN